MWKPGSAATPPEYWETAGMKRYPPGANVAVLIGALQQVAQNCRRLRQRPTIDKAVPASAHLKKPKTAHGRT
jgi:hypothetical protein